METLPWSLEKLVAGVVFAGARVGGLMVFAPFFGSDSISVPVKAGFTVAVTVLLYPVYAGLGMSMNLPGWIRVAGGEAMIGLLLGLTLQFLLDAAGLAGQMMGIQAGFSLVSILDPQTQADTPVFSALHQLAVLLIFLRLNVHHWLLRGLAASFSYLPPGGGGVNFAVAGTLLRAAAAIWLVGVQIAAPIVAATLLCDVALGFLSKASPQLPVMFFGVSIKSLLGLAVLASSLAVWPRIWEHQFAVGLGLGERLLHLAR